MKKQCLIALTLIFLLMLSACGTPSSNTPSNTGSEDKPSSTVPDNTPSNDTPASGNSVTDDFLKTITAETAEAKGVCGADLTWYYQDGVLVIKGTGEMTNFYVSSGETNMPWVDYQDQIGWVFIQDGVTSIGAYSFWTCRALTKIEIPETVETIGVKAFEYCSRLPSITLPDSVTHIGEFAFLYCSKLTDITIPASVTDIGDGTFGNSGLTTVTFLGDAPDGVGDVLDCIKIYGGENKTVHYSGTGFDELIERYPNINWVKQ